MITFFSSIQNLFRAEYGGRYLGVLLAEVCRVDPRPFAKFLAAEFSDSRYLTKQLETSAELTFRVPTGLRRADVAVILNGEPAALVELKFNDKLRPEIGHRPAQLTDYLRACRRRRLDFLLLTREPPSPSDAMALRKAGQRHAHFARLAEHFRNASHPVSQMLFEYLQERGLTMQPLNEDHLYRFFHRLLKRWGHAGRIISKDSLSEGPAQFQALLANMRLLATDLGSIGRNSDGTGINRGPTIDFQIDPHLDVAALQREIQKQPGEAVLVGVSDKVRRGGLVFVYAMRPIGGRSGKWLYLEYGIGFEVRPGRSRRLFPFAFAQVYGQGFTRAGVGNLFVERPLRFSALAHPDRRQEVLRAILSVIRRSARRAARVNVLTRKGRLMLKSIASG